MPQAKRFPLKRLLVLLAAFLTLAAVVGAQADQVEVTFKLNHPDALFSDHTTADKTFEVDRGVAIDTNKDVEDSLMGPYEPGFPEEGTSYFDPDWGFDGWWSKGANGEWVPFDMSSPVDEDITLYARWQHKMPYAGTVEDSSVDLRIGGDTTREQAYGAAMGEALTFTFDVDLKPMKQRVREIKALYPDDPQIFLTEYDTDFFGIMDMCLHVLEPVEIAGPIEVTLQGGSTLLKNIRTKNGGSIHDAAPGLYAADQQGQVLYIDIGMDGYRGGFFQWAEQVEALPDALSIDVKGIRVSESADIGKQGKVDTEGYTRFYLNVYDDPEQVVSNLYYITSDFRQSSASRDVNASESDTYPSLTVEVQREAEGGIWIDDQTGVKYATLAEAVETAAEGATIHLAGDLDYAAVGTTTIGKNLTLEITRDATLTGDGASNGITLAAGSHLRCSPGAKLTMTGFGTALTLSEGAEINDGTYHFLDNKSQTRGIALLGRVKGSGDRDSLKITADDLVNKNFFEGTATFENCTIDVNSQTWTERQRAPIHLKNTALTVSGFSNFIVGGGEIDKSSVRMRSPGGTYDRESLEIRDSGVNITDSTILVDHGKSGCITVDLNTQPTMTIANSTLQFSDVWNAGLEVNRGTVTIDNTTIQGRGAGDGTYVLAGVYNASRDAVVIVQNDSLIETPGSAPRDNAVSFGENNNIVLGGSHRIRHLPGNFGWGTTVPTNGTANGGESLDYVTLNGAAFDGSQPITVLNKLGSTYEYHVKNASGDGKRHVWVPTEPVTFQLGRPDAQFADGATSDKVMKAIRGNGLILTENGMPEDPVVPSVTNDTGKQAYFAGWFYDDANGQPHAFEETTSVNAPSTVYARWEMRDPAPNTHYFSFKKRWIGGDQKNIQFTLYKGDGTVKSHGMNKSQPGGDEPLYLYEAWFADADDYYVIETPPEGYRARYENVGRYADVTDRAYNGGTITNYLVPKTGDRTNLALWLGLMALGGAGLIAYVLQRRRHVAH